MSYDDDDDSDNKFDRAALVAQHGEPLVKMAEAKLGDMLGPLPAGAILVFPFYDAPEVLQKLCCFNGGDEDWMVIMREAPSDYLPTWVVKTGNDDDPDCYVFDNAVIYVGSHA